MKVSEIRSLAENGGLTRQLFTLYGEDNSAAGRLIDLCDRFISLFGDSAEACVVSTPGRTEIAGNHTDHNLGLVATAGVNLDILAVAVPSGSSRTCIGSTKYPTDSLDLSELTCRADEKGTSAGLVRGVAQYFAEHGLRVGGFYAVTDNRVLKGSGLSSSAAFEVEIAEILNVLYNGGKVDAITLAKAGQYAENRYYGKPSGLLDQTACAFGSFVSIDFADPEKPAVTSLPFDLESMDLEMWVVDTGGTHADLTDDYASIPNEMHTVARCFGKEQLREISLEQLISDLGHVRKTVGDRAALRAFHYLAENRRVPQLLEAVKTCNTHFFLSLIRACGQSSFMYNQNAYSTANVREQGISVAYALADAVLDTSDSAFRLQGGGFAGTLQVFLPHDAVSGFLGFFEQVFGKGSCHRLTVRNLGAVSLLDL